MRSFGAPARRSRRAALKDCWATEAPAPRPKPRYFEYLPVGFFGSVMGLTGLSIAWKLASQAYQVSEWISGGIALLAMVWFIVLATAYGIKALTAFDVVRGEFRHPVAGNLFGTILVSLLLLPIVLAPVFRSAAQIIWCVGAVGMVGFAWLMVDRWMGERQQVAQATPAWIVPVVGLIDVPLAVPSLNLPAAHGVTVACMAIGLFFAIPLFTILFSRLLFEEPLLLPLQPMLLILVAPFAVGFSSYVATNGQVDLFAEGLYWIMLFLLAVLLGRLRQLLHCCPFRVAWWSVSFPLAAAAASAVRFAMARPSLVADSIAWGLLALATTVIAALAIRTVVGIARGELKALSQ
ncbi:SLAC1 anion channel family protein [Sphingomonas sp. RB3P16]|uniref:SLAC1 anion channel family protein n=1 Tax=Parasphingomonas frigoris TaxID=3096163 RepID=UPI002FCBFC95